MSVATVLSWMLCGLIVGAIARFLVPGRLNIGLLFTMVLGLVGAIVGGFLYSLIQGCRVSLSHFPAMPGTVGSWRSLAVLVVWAYWLLYPRRWWQ